ncbi:MAG: metallophosphoesterase [Ignavibacteriales bacterium]|nr:metallophosphoesterase [Ignavibacteriales bacterium]
MLNCFFVSDVHGSTELYKKLFDEIFAEKPQAVFLGGDLLPHHYNNKNFILDFLQPNLQSLKIRLEIHYPNIFLILGNDDARIEEPLIQELEKQSLIEYIHFRKTNFLEYDIYGYAFTPPSPFLLKDWEKYDVSRFVDPGSISPEEGKRTIDVSIHEKKYSTIKDDLDALTIDEDLSKSIFLFHGPPYQTNLDRAALDGKLIDHAPVDTHVGSVAIKRFIEKKQPLITLHGHIHESARISGSWKDKIGRTYCFSAAHDGSELAIVKFEFSNPENTERILL